MAIPLTKGSYVMWLDADDILLPDNVAAKVRALELNPDCGMVLCEGVKAPADHIDAPSGRLSWMPHSKAGAEDTLFSDLIYEKNVVFVPGTMLVRKDVFDQAIPTGDIFESTEGQNWQLLLPLTYATKCCYLHDRLFVCLEHSDSHSRRRRSLEELVERQNNFEKLLRETVRRIPAMPDSEKEQWHKSIHVKCASKIIESSWRAGNRTTAKDTLKSLRAEGLNPPLSLRSHTVWLGTKAVSRLRRMAKRACVKPSDTPLLPESDRAFLLAMQQRHDELTDIKEPGVARLGERCCGCGACSAICPSGCISMQRDSLGFPRPKVDVSKCIRCGRCDSTCPVLSPRGEGDTLWAGRALACDSKIRRASSSGGVFGLLARYVLDSGGAVYGASYGTDPAEVLHIRVGSVAELGKLMTSKYVQSTLEKSVICQIGKDLGAGLPVLFSGTACQCAAIANYLERKNVIRDRLLLVDVVCHGVPSPMLWRRWLDYVKDVEKASVEKVNFRSKSSGWLNFSVAYYLSNGAVRETTFREDWYMQAFLSDASLRGSCLSCPSKRGCGSDLTLGDFWGVQRLHPEVDCKLGVSCVVAHSKKGMAAIEGLSESIETVVEDYDDVVAGNPALVRSVAAHPRRIPFLRNVSDGMDMAQLVHKWTFRKSPLLRLCRKVKRSVLWWK